MRCRPFVFLLLWGALLFVPACGEGGAPSSSDQQATDSATAGQNGEDVPAEEASTSSSSSSASEDRSSNAEPHPALRDPSEADLTAPETFRVRMNTTAGTFVMEAHRDWAPHGVDRFYNLVKIGYFEDIAFFRVIDGFMAQFGIHGDPAVNRAWKNAAIPDDPVKKSNKRGFVTFAKKRTPDSRTTQLFINSRDNSKLDRRGFAPIGKVVRGMDVVDDLYAGYGEGAPRGDGPRQGKIMRKGNEYLKNEFSKLDYLKSATVVE